MRRLIVLTVVIALCAAVPANAEALILFVSPSGNVGCVISKRFGARCDVRRHAWEPPPRPASCPQDLEWGYGLTIDRRGRGTYICATDSAFGGEAAIGRGDAIRSGRFRCNGIRGGMRCVNLRNRHGFAVTRERARVF